MNKIETLSKELFELQRTPKFRELILHNLIGIRFIDFLEFNFRAYRELYLNELLIASHEHWKQLKKSDWEDIFKSQSDHLNKMVFLISFLYKYAKVDFWNHLEQSNFLSKKIKTEIRNEFNNRPGLLKWTEMDKKLCSQYGVTRKALKTAGSQLHSQGLPLVRVDEVKPTKISDLIYDKTTGNYVPKKS